MAESPYLTEVLPLNHILTYSVSEVTVALVLLHLLFQVPSQHHYVREYSDSTLH